MEKLLALYDSDFFYATRFMEYMNRRKDSGFIVSAFTRKESLEEYLRTHIIELLLLSNDISTEDWQIKNVKHILILTENPMIKAEQRLLMIYKYQSANKIMEEIQNIYKEKESFINTTDRTNQTEILSVFAPSPSAEKLSFAWSIGSLLSEQNNVLFILLDPLPVPLLPVMDNKCQSLTEFIYYLKEGTGHIEKMKSLLIQNGRNHLLYGASHGADILSLSREDAQRWVEELRASEDFRYIIFYLGYYNEATIEFMKLSDTILIAALDNNYETAVIREWEQQMGHTGSNILQDRIRYICLHYQDVQSELPLTMQELKNSPAWQQAVQYLNV